MRSEGDAFGGDFAQFAEAENLEAARVGEDGAGPGHKFVQAAELADQLMARTKIEMIGVREQNLDAEIFEVLLGLAFDGSGRAHGHKRRRVDYAVGRGEAAESRTGGIGSEDFEFESAALRSFGTRRHPCECIRRMRP